MYNNVRKQYILHGKFIPPSVSIYVYNSLSAYMCITYNIYILSDIIGKGVVVGGGHAGTAYIADLKGDSCLSYTA